MCVWYIHLSTKTHESATEFSLSQTARFAAWPCYNKLSHKSSGRVIKSVNLCMGKRNIMSWV
jgi:hypothetical protein